MQNPQISERTELAHLFWKKECVREPNSKKHFNS